MLAATVLCSSTWSKEAVAISEYNRTVIHATASYYGFGEKGLGKYFADGSRYTRKKEGIACWFGKLGDRVVVIYTKPDGTQKAVVTKIIDRGVNPALFSTRQVDLHEPTAKYLIDKKDMDKGLYKVVVVYIGR